MEKIFKILLLTIVSTFYSNYLLAQAKSAHQPNGSGSLPHYDIPTAPDSVKHLSPSPVNTAKTAPNKLNVIAKKDSAISSSGKEQNAKKMPNKTQIDQTNR